MASILNRSKLKTKLTSPFLNRYLEYVEETETPRLMHVWCALSTASACLGRRVFIPSGAGNLYPNLYTILVGPPGVRKSTAIRQSKNLTGACNLNFAPDDTGGQRQGLIKAIAGQKTDEENMVEELDSVGEVSAEAIANLKTSFSTDPVNRHVLYVCASEITSLWGQDVAGMLPFFNKLFDGEEFKYSLAKENTIIRDGLMTILGATTTSQIKTTFPQEAIGQGFMSRCIFVYGADKYKKLPEAPMLSEEIFNELSDILGYIAHQFEGPITWEEDAAEYRNDIYTEKLEFQDARFLHYEDRRHDHIKKISMILATLRNSFTISLDDISDAHILLKHTEQFMPEALGEYGLSALSLVKQKIVDFLKHHGEPVPTSIVYSMVASDVKLPEFVNCMAELINAEKLAKITVEGVDNLVTKRSKRAMEQDTLFTSLGEL